MKFNEYCDGVLEGLGHEIAEKSTNFMVDITKLYVMKSKLIETLAEVDRGETSRSLGAPLLLSKMGRNKFFVLDGNHRVVEAIRRREGKIEAKIDEYVPDLNRTAGAYNGFIENSVNIAEFVKTVDADNITEKDITPSTDPDVISLWHGGNFDMNGGSDTIKFSKKRVEYGPGLYLTVDWSVAKKYAGGRRRLHLIHVKRGVDISEVNITVDEAYGFIDQYTKKALRGECKQYIDRRANGDVVSLDTLSTICINLEALQPVGLSALREFIISAGADYKIHQSGYGGHFMMVLFNTEQVVGVDVYQSGDNITDYDLDGEFN